MGTLAELTKERMSEESKKMERVIFSTLDKGSPKDIKNISIFDKIKAFRGKQYELETVFWVTPDRLLRYWNPSPDHVSYEMRRDLDTEHEPEHQKKYRVEVYRLECKRNSYETCAPILKTFFQTMKKRPGMRYFGWKLLHLMAKEDIQDIFFQKKESMSILSFQSIASVMGQRNVAALFKWEGSGNRHPFFFRCHQWNFYSDEEIYIAVPFEQH